MNIKNLYRKFLILWQSFPKAMSSLKDSPLKRPIYLVSNFFASAGIITGIFFRFLAWTVFICFTVIWVIGLILSIDGYYLNFIGEEYNSVFLFMGGLIEFTGIAVIGTVYDEKTRAVEKAISDFIKSNIFSKFINESIYKLSKFCFDVFVFPNIDFFEPGLIGQLPSNFPETVIYQDNSSRNERQIREIQGKYDLYIGIIPILLLIGLSIFACALGILLSEIGQSLNLEILTIIESIILGLIIVFICLTPLVTTLLLNHPYSLIYKRKQILQHEIFQLQDEEWLQKKITRIESDSEKLIEKSSIRLAEINNTLRQEAMKLSELQKKAFLTKENIEAMENFKNMHPEAALLMYKEQEKRQEEREKKKRWKNWMIDILIGIISALIFRLIFG